MGDIVVSLAVKLTEEKKNRLRNRQAENETVVAVFSVEDVDGVEAV